MSYHFFIWGDWNYLNAIIEISPGLFNDSAEKYSVKYLNEDKLILTKLIQIDNNDVLIEYEFEHLADYYNPSYYYPQSED